MDMLKLINKIISKLDKRMDVKYEAFTQFWRDAKILWIEVPFMALLGCDYHLRTKVDDKTGWYKDSKFVCEQM